MNSPSLEKPRKNIHTISFFVANKPGVLVRIALVFARRGYNIDSLVVSPSVDPKYSRMTITAIGDPVTLEQIIKQSAKLIDVLHVEEHTGIDSIDREFALLKVKYTPSGKNSIIKLLKKYHAKISHSGEGVAIIQQAGTTEELDTLEIELKKFGVLEMVRSGKLVMAKGKKIT